jgi:high-affinity iron transporter
MGNAAFIVWRETIEAMLVVGILHGWLPARSELLPAQRRRALRWLWGGVGAGWRWQKGWRTLLGIQA